MELNESSTELTYQHEVLLAKLEIRDHYLQTIVKEIYENTGQLLSLVRVQLAIIGSKIDGESRSGIEESGNLVARIIRDLREMSKHFDPENEILSSESGLINALKRELNINIEDNTGNKVKVKGIPSALLPNSGIIFFSVILEITSLIARSYEKDSLRLEIFYLNTKIKISMDYYGKPIDFNAGPLRNSAFSGTRKLNVKERIRLIGGRLTIENKNDSRTRIDVSIPFHNYKVA